MMHYNKKKIHVKFFFFFTAEVHHLISSRVISQFDDMKQQHEYRPV
jgi:hypothetical protein